VGVRGDGWSSSPVWDAPAVGSVEHPFIDAYFFPGRKSGSNVQGWLFSDNVGNSRGTQGAKRGIETNYSINTQAYK